MNKTIKKPLKNNEIRFIIFQKEKNWYGVALELNIIEIHKDPNTTLYNLIEAITGYIETAIKNNIQLSSLKQTPDKKYETIWNQISKTNQQKNNIFMFGKKTLTKA